MFKIFSNKSPIISPKIKGLLEIVKSQDSTKTILKKIRNLNENSLVNGYVTITKNKGRVDESVIQVDVKNLLTDGGRDFFHEQIYTNTGSGTQGGNAIALSDDPGNPSVSDTNLVGEIVVDGLTRVQASTIAHSVNTNVTTLENVFTASGVFIAIHKSALFNNNVSAGQITHSTAFGADVNLQVSDTLTVTWTLTLG